MKGCLNWLDCEAEWQYPLSSFNSKDGRKLDGTWPQIALHRFPFPS
jgi:hypothetical protein